MLLLWSADFFKINFFKKLFQEHYLSVKQFGSRSDRQNVQNSICKGYLQTTKVVVWRKDLKVHAPLPK